MNCHFQVITHRTGCNDVRKGAEIARNQSLFNALGAIQSLINGCFCAICWTKLVVDLLVEQRIRRSFLRYSWTVYAIRLFTIRRQLEALSEARLSSSCSFQSSAGFLFTTLSQASTSWSTLSAGVIASLRMKCPNQCSLCRFLRRTMSNSLESIAPSVVVFPVAHKQSRTNLELAYLTITDAVCGVPLLMTQGMNMLSTDHKL